MPQLIKNNVVTQDDWIVLGREEEIPSGSSCVLVHMRDWLANVEQLHGQSHIGVWLDSDDIADALDAHYKSLSLIAINFPVFSDGRGYSLAQQMREKYGYEGELRAIGDVLKDQIFFYQRCGFDSFAVRDDRSVEQALDSIEDFSVVYQSGADARTPALRKR